jgi:D-serine deaminase-like pyridoxal phosphate-dependent protein
MGLSRRQFITAAGITAVGAAALKPRAHGAPHDPYFKGIGQALRQAGIGQPTLVLDLARLRDNAQHVHGHIGGRMGLRLVNKSLPCLSLLDELSRLCHTQRQMVFNLPYLQLLASQRPDSDILMGKPLPVAAAAQFYAHRPSSAFDPARQLQWLVDTPTRLQQYRDLARAQRQPMRLNIEIDVGLHRGGVPDAAVLQEMITLLQSEPLLRWSGLMGYDAHTEKIPDVGGLRTYARTHSKALYQEMAQHMARHMAASPLNTTREPLTLNTGGSPSYRLHDGSGAANELSVGSAMVKPSDFDTDLLADLQAAAYIATPVIKSGPWVAPDGVAWLGHLVASWDPNQRHGVFIYGGNWLAKPVSPEGLTDSGLIGHSSNQQLLVGSGQQALSPDDWVFWRPTQSEAVLQQFGDIAVYDQGRISAMWPVFPAQA